MDGKGQFSFGIFFLVILLIWGGVSIYNKAIFNINCGGLLKRAADANTIELAKQEMKLALDYMEQEGMTSGYTSVLYNSPSEDVGFWYKNIKSSYEELVSLPDDVTPLERSNILMKLRETLLDSGGDGATKVTLPRGISIFPHNVLFAWWGWVSSILCCVFFVWCIKKNK